VLKQTVVPLLDWFEAAGVLTDVRHMEPFPASALTEDAFAVSAWHAPQRFQPLRMLQACTVGVSTPRIAPLVDAGQVQDIQLQLLLLTLRGGWAVDCWQVKVFNLPLCWLVESEVVVVISEPDF
jgi:hypothetical protein